MPSTMRSAFSKRDASSLIFPHVAVSDGVIASPETPLYLAPIASAPNSGSDSVHTSNVSTTSPLIFSWHAKRNESMIAMDADRSFLGEVTMFKIRIPSSFLLYAGQAFSAPLGGWRAIPPLQHRRRYSGGTPPPRTTGSEVPLASDTGTPF